MRRAGMLFVVLASSAPAFGQAPSPGFTLGEIDFGVQPVTVDTDSSKFREYRDVPNGAIVPRLRIAGDDGTRYDLRAEGVLQQDARYSLSLERGPVRVDVDYNKIPHRFGNGARSLERETSPGVFEISDTLQSAFQSAIAAQWAASKPSVNFAFLSNLVAPSLAAAGTFDLALIRNRGNVDVRLALPSPLDVHLTYFQENRKGNRPYGTSFGFGDAVETPEPIDYRTQDVGVSAEYGGKWGLVRAGAHYNEFVNSNLSTTFDNPFRVTDATDASAYTAPGAGSIGGAARGRVSLNPSNKSLNGSLGFIVKLPANSRLTADLSYARWTQDESFIPYSTNTAITTPLNAVNPASLPVQSLDGAMNVLSVSASFTTRPFDRFGFTARYRHWNLDNRTARISFPGYARFDAVWEDIPRISVPYGNTTDRADLTFSYDLGLVSLNAGYRYNGVRREFRETEKTKEHTAVFSADVRPAGWALLRASYEKGKRTFDEYEFERSEEASYADPGPPAQLPVLRRFDQANKKVDKFTGLLQVTPVSDVVVALSYLYSKDDYSADSSFGLLKASSGSFNAEVDYSPSERLNFFGYYTRESVSTFLYGRQSGATPSTDPVNDWSSDVSINVDTAGLGANLSLLPDKLLLTLWGRYQKVDGNNDLRRPPANPVAGLPISQYDDSRIVGAGAELRYRLSRAWSIAIGGWLENYQLQDAQTTGVTNYMPAEFALAARDDDYKGRVGYLRATYRW